MPNYNFFAAYPLETSEISSPIIKYNSFALPQSDTVLWTPATGKSIYLTSVEMSTLISLTATLQRAGDAPFLVVQFSTLVGIVPYRVTFPSPIKFNVNERISITTGAIGSFNITLTGYEL